MRARAVAAAVLAAAVALPALAAPTEKSPDPAVAIEAERAVWQARFRRAQDAVASAQIRQRGALDAYQQMRHHRRERGEAKQKILDELTASEAALAEAEAALVDLFETARRAGVPPGWMRIRRADLPAAPEPSSEGEDKEP